MIRSPYLLTKLYTPMKTLVKDIVVMGKMKNCQNIERE